MTAKLFEDLRIAEPWSVASVDFDQASKVLTISIDFLPGSRFAVSGHEGVHPGHQPSCPATHLKFNRATFYIYYSVPPDRIASARRAVMALFAELKASTGVSGRLSRRHDNPGFWMEIYERVTDIREFELLLNAGEVRHGLDRPEVSGLMRKTEIFVEDVLEPDLLSGGTLCA